ncbi:hypothetical protein [Candidatus Frankia alpina]|uniref:hypothetical protein n=1 Tax=Candidatus Frankia alpina TaxID=2699483 RepID=UPI0013D5A252|nr:hypothetical protein [Candidatus Frankia alpina]
MSEPPGKLPAVPVPIGVDCYAVLLETARFAVVVDGVLADHGGVEIHLTAVGADLLFTTTSEHTRPEGDALLELSRWIRQETSSGPPEPEVTLDITSPAMPGPPSATVTRSGSWLGRAYAVLRVEPIPARGDLHCAAALAGDAAEMVISGDDLRRASDAAQSFTRRGRDPAGGS